MSDDRKIRIEEMLNYPDPELQARIKNALVFIEELERERDTALAHCVLRCKDAWNEAIEAAAKEYVHRGNNNYWTFWAETEKAIRALKR